MRCFQLFPTIPDQTWTNTCNCLAAVVPQIPLLQTLLLTPLWPLPSATALERRQRAHLTTTPAVRIGVLSEVQVS